MLAFIGRVEGLRRVANRSEQEEMAVEDGE